MQTQIHITGNKVYWKKFLWGEIQKHKSTFLVIKRNEKNVFRLFGRGLGLNLEILYLLKDLKISYIEVPFKDKILRTTTAKWLAKGIKSPFVSSRVDQQLILPISEINIKSNVRNTSKQLAIFSGGSL